MNSPTVLNQAAVDVATVVQRLTGQYFTHVAAMYVARDRRAERLAPPVEPGQSVPILRIPRRDGTDMMMWFNHYLERNSDPDTVEAFDRVWLTGALLAAGDLLGRFQYFGHEPEAEIVRHLRNGVAHGNRFTFHPNVLDKGSGKLKHPANIFRYSALQGMPRHEVDSHLQDSEVLWSWGGPDAVVDCLTVLGVHLWNIGHGLPVPHP